MASNSFAKQRRGVVISTLTFVLSAILLTTALPASAAVSNPVVQGPIGGGLRGRPWESTLFDITPYGYTEQEFFYAGTANSFGQGAVFGQGGTGKNTLAPYKTRMIVRRPVDPARFNGTVIVEWLNVTGQNDLETAWPVAWQSMIKQGFAYVGISAQLAGVCCAPGSLKVWDPDRYGTLVHPGDAYSYDIFSQGIQAMKSPLLNRTTILSPNVIDPMGGLPVQRIIATGASQSASFLTTYVNAIHKTARVVDAFIITRGGGPYPNLDTPILQLNEEGNLSAHSQPDGQFFRLWEEAGTSHAPAAWWTQYTWPANNRDLAGTPLPDAVNTACSVNRGSVNYSSDAAGYWVDQWLRNGTPPPAADRLVLDSSNHVVRDANGLALGGLRHPFVQVPVALNYAAGNAGAQQGCALWGSYEPWTQAKIQSLYPTQAVYVQKVHDWAELEVVQGFLLRDDAKDVESKAQAFDVWSGNIGSCFDSQNPGLNENGPVSSVLGNLAYGALESMVGFGVPSAVHEGSCEVVAPLGL